MLFCFSPRAQSGRFPVEPAADRIPSSRRSAVLEEQRPLRPPVTTDKGPAPTPASRRAGYTPSTRSSSDRATRYSLASSPSCPGPLRRSLVRKPYLACPLPRLVLTVILPPSYGIRLG
ncbi:hypothetical protein PVAP13_7KG023418 [Panicum virgatum]|uniref:Uncharacterized protein n=1 Tax=Panicum virgatum TaxID=38727 RepID=A0A8T0QBE7_PANVG|nr:hypothetical protein PVAP13_7KG023418 [Panicum virgatum]